MRKELSDQGYDAGARTLRYHLAERGHEVPALATIHRVLQRRGFVTPQPVSYTHLQRRAGVAARTHRDVQPALSDSLANFRTRERDQTNTLGPVSYTHLDVYKRQVSPFATTSRLSSS